MSVPTQLLDRDYCLDFSWGKNGKDQFQVLVNELYDNTRWSLLYDLVVKDVEANTYWRTTYSVGATESQDEEPWEYSGPNWIEVAPVETTTTIYKAVE